MNRRDTVLALVTLIAMPLAASAQQKERQYRIGVLSAPSLAATYIEAIRQGLRDHGYVDGRNLHIEWRIADGSDEKLPKFAAELVGMRVDVIVTVAPQAAIAAKKATTAIPIVFTLVADPVAYGLVQTLARPDGNLTGLSALQVELIGKGLELLKETLPSLKSIALLSNPGSPGHTLVLQALRPSAVRLSLDVRVIEARDPSGLVSAFTDIAKTGVQAVVLAPDAFFFSHRTQIMDFTTKARLPVLGWNQQLSESGALISYGANVISIYRRAGYFIDKILKGAKPRDLPVEQPTIIDLVVNLKTAKALGITIPQSLLLRADQVIE